MRILGTRAMNSLSKPPVLVAIGSAIVAGIGILKFARWTFNLQGAVLSKPVPHKKERQNPWKKEEFDLSKFDTAPASRSVGKKDYAAMIELFRKNLYQVANETTTNRGFRGFIFGLKGNKFLASNHTIPKGGFFMNVFKHNLNPKGVTNNRSRIWITDDQIDRFPDHDQCIVTIPNLPPCKDLTKYIAPATFDNPCPGIILHIDPTKDVTIIRMIKDEMIHREILPNLPKSWYCNISEDTMVGDCGRIHVSLGPTGPQICGVHFAGKSNSKLALSSPLLNNYFDESKVVSGGTPMLSSASAPMTLGPVHPKAPIRWVPEGTAEIYGSFMGTRSALKSMVDVSPIAPLLAKYPEYNIKYTAPDLRSWRPKNIALNKMLVKPTGFRNDIIEKCKKSFSQRYFESFAS